MKLFKKSNSAVFVSNNLKQIEERATLNLSLKQHATRGYDYINLRGSGKELLGLDIVINNYDRTLAILKDNEKLFNDIALMTGLTTQDVINKLKMGIL